MSETTQQVTTPPNPTGKGGFGDHPENRNPGGWKKEESISYQYNKLLRMSPEDIENFTPTTVAEKIALNRLMAALKDDSVYALSETKEITDRTEGKAPQFVKLDADIYTNPYKDLTPEELRKLAGE